ncbi:MAG: NADH-quinone oxidoreductase subunit A [Pirellulales bacterium]|nr:NADH-quinone oxidoreductase subunit A [Pirellulales bacterium]
MTPTSIVGYLALFTAVGFGFLFVNLMVGWLLRPRLPNPEKLEVYECGEPTIGSSFIQFDLRFYVIALLFIIFDVEIAFFFPWATVFGKATHLEDKRFAVVAAVEQVEPAGDPASSAPAKTAALTPAATTLLSELGVPNPATQVPADEAAIKSTAQQIVRFALVDIGVFFAVLMVGFAYVWKRGDLDWVRALSNEVAAARPTGGRKPVPERDMALAG